VIGVTGTGHFEYALFALRKWTFDKVIYPDGTTSEDVTQGEGTAAAERWLRGRFEQEELPGLEARFQADRAAWQAGYQPWRRNLTVTHDVAKVGPGSLLRRRLPVIRIAGESVRYAVEPDGSYQPEGYIVTVQADRANAHRHGDPLPAVPDGAKIVGAHFDEARNLLEASAESIMKDLYRRERPEPSLPGDENFNTWKAARSPRPRVETGQRGWTAALYTASGKDQVRIDAPDWWAFGWPEAEVTEILNRLGGDGWQAFSVTEDKGLYKGSDALNESGPVAVRYLLMRSRP
jgi:hypothetical protein